MQQESFKKSLFLNLFFLGVLVILIGLFAVLGWGQKKVEIEVREMGLSDFKAVYDQKARTADKFIILDLRSRKDWENSLIPGSVPFSVDRLGKFNNLQKLEEYKEIGIVSDDVDEAQLLVDRLKAQSWSSDKKIYLLKVPVDQWFSAGYNRRRFIL